MKEFTSFGKKLFALQCDHRLKSKEMAEKLGIPPCVLSGYKRRENPGPEIIKKVCDTFAVPVSYFIDN